MLLFLCSILHFTPSALPSSLAAASCDSRRPIAAQAHVEPCEAGASLRYIAAATGCHGNTRAQSACVLYLLNIEYQYLYSTSNVRTFRVVPTTPEDCEG